MFTSLFILPAAVLLLCLLGLAWYLLPKKPGLPRLKRQNPQKNEREIRSVLLKQLQSLHELHTAVATIQVLVTGEEESAPFGFFKKSNKMLYVASARVRAGVDLSKLDENSIQVLNGQLQVRIPKAELFDVCLDLDKSFVHDIRTHRLCPASIALHEDTQRKALEAVEREACRSGVLEQAQEQAEAIVARLAGLMPDLDAPRLHLRGQSFQERRIGKNETPTPDGEGVCILFPKGRPGGSFAS